MANYSKRITEYCDKVIKISVFLTVLLVPLFYFPVTQSVFRTPKEVLFLFLLFLGTAAWLIKTIESREVSIPKLAVSIPLLAFWFISFFSMIKADFNYYARRDLIALSSYLLFFALLISSLKNKKQVNRIFFALITVAFIAAVYGISQFYGYSFTFKLPSTDRLRLYSTFGNPNRVAHFIATVLPISFSLLLLKRDKLWKTLLLLSITASYIFFLISGTRTAILALFFGIISWILLFFIGKLKAKSIFKQNWGWLTALTLTLIFFTVIYSTNNPLSNPDKGRSEFTSERFKQSLAQGTMEDSAAKRLWNWRVTLNMVKDNPILGVGIGNYRCLSAEYQGEYIEKHPDDSHYPRNLKEAHNDYLQIWAETGSLGLLAFLAFLFTLCIIGLQAVMKSTGKFTEGLLIIGILSGLVIYLAQTFISFPLHVIENVVLFITAGALLITTPKIYGIDESWQYVSYQLWNALLPKREVIKRVFQVGTVVIFGVLTLFTVQRFRADVHLRRARKLCQKNEPEAAYTECQKALSLWPFDWKIYYQLGLIYSVAEMYDKAIDFFSIAEEYMIRSDIVHSKGVAYQGKGEFKKAEREYMRAIYYLPKSAKVYISLGLLYYEAKMNEQNEQVKSIGSFEKSIESFNKAIEMYSGKIEDWLKEDISIKKLVNNKTAVKEWVKPWMNKGIVLAQMGDFEEAIECFNKALQINPMDINVWYNKGVALKKTEHYDKAINCFDKIIEINPKYAKAWYNKGKILYQLERYKEAKEYSNKAVKLGYSKAQEMLEHID